LNTMSEVLPLEPTCRLMNVRVDGWWMGELVWLPVSDCICDHSYCIAKGKYTFPTATAQVCRHICKQTLRAGTAEFPSLCLTGSQSFPRSADLDYRLQTQNRACFPVYRKINNYGFSPVIHF
jgi:hypothetical protein